MYVEKRTLQIQDTALYNEGVTILNNKKVEIKKLADIF